MKIVLATHNQDKCTEMKAILGGINLELITLNEFPEIGEIIEDGDTLIGNALIKARTWTKLILIDQDSTALPTDLMTKNLYFNFLK